MPPFLPPSCAPPDRPPRLRSCRAPTLALAGHLSVVHRLLAANADVNAKNNDGATALMLATYAQKEGVVRLLIGSGAKQGLSAALAFAEQADAQSLVGVLREASPSGSHSLGWLPWAGLTGGVSGASDGSAMAPFDLGFLPLAVGLMIVGFMLLLFQLDADADGGGGGALGTQGLGDASGGLGHADLKPPR